MQANVFFTDLRSHGPDSNKVTKIKKLFDAAGFANAISKNDLTAVKVHFGERGNDAYVSPVFVRQVVDKIREAGGSPFLTDTNTLYKGERHNGVTHIGLAIEHGFCESVVNAPVVIADGIKSESFAEVEINKKHFKKVKIANAIVQADSMIVVSHFKGHDMAGFGGAIKNLAMGCAPFKGKRDQHAVRPYVTEKCIGCGICAEICPEHIIKIENKKAIIDVSKCVGCCECVTHCKVGGMDIQWETEIGPFTERIAEYALGSIKHLNNKKGFINFVMNITPSCDCFGWSDAPIANDIGILASTDPVALDKACYDLVVQQMDGKDKFKELRPHTVGNLQFEYGQQIGLGTTDYKLIKI